MRQLAALVSAGSLSRKAMRRRCSRSETSRMQLPSLVAPAAAAGTQQQQQQAVREGRHRRHHSTNKQLPAGREQQVQQRI